MRSSRSDWKKLREREKNPTSFQGFLMVLKVALRFVVFQVSLTCLTKISWLLCNWCFNSCYDQWSQIFTFVISTRTEVWEELPSEAAVVEGVQMICSNLLLTEEKELNKKLRHISSESKCSPSKMTWLPNKIIAANDVNTATKNKAREKLYI